MEWKTDRLYENVPGPSAGCLICLPSWADVDVLADGERVLEACRTDYKGRLFLSEDFWDKHAGKTFDVYVRQTYEERDDGCL